MITVHYLNDSRSQRVSWLPGELGLANARPARQKALERGGKCGLVR